MARKKRTRTSDRDGVKDFRHTEARRRNNPPAGVAPTYEVRERQTQKYDYDPHLDPQLVWAGKAEHTSFEVDVVSLHIHERISTSAILQAVRRPEPIQPDLFGETPLPADKQVEFYQHEVDWANRLILGDSLLVMNSLLVKEGMAGKVQMIYIDPPYGIKYASNFQPRIDRRDVKDKDEDLTHEPEQIKAYRDTWKLGIHSYLTYLRDRLLLARELLTESGSIFVQINDENLHLVRCLLDEVFGRENFQGLITFRTAISTNNIFGISDYLLWYSKNYMQTKKRVLFIDRPQEKRESTFSHEDEDGKRFKPTDELWGSSKDALFEPYEFEGKSYQAPRGKGYKWGKMGMKRLEEAGLLWASANYLYIARQRLMTAKFDYYELREPERGPAGGFIYETVPHITLESIAKNTEIDAIAAKYQPEIDRALADLNRALGEDWKEWEVPREVPHPLWSDEAKQAYERLRSLGEIKTPKEQEEAERLLELIYRQTGHRWTLKDIPDPVPADDWSDDAKQALRRFWELKRAKRQEIDASIQRNAPQETLYDRPKVINGVVRVSGPFTVEAIPVPVVEDPTQAPIPQFETEEAYARVSDRGGDYLTTMINLLKQQGGVLFPGGKKLELANIRPLNLGYLHAEAEATQNGSIQRVAISLGPQHGPVIAHQVQEAIPTARMNGYNILIFAGFAFDPEAQALIQKVPVAGLQVHFANIAPDVLVGDLLKTTRASQIFTVFGQPDVRISPSPFTGRVGVGATPSPFTGRAGEGATASPSTGRAGEGATASPSTGRAGEGATPSPSTGRVGVGATYIVELRGVDIYDPLTGEVHSTRGEDVAAWFLDADYDGKTFRISQAFFPGDPDAWEKLQRALKAHIDPEAFERMRGTVSFPFQLGEHKRIAVKVIDFRGNEVMRVVKLAEEVDYQ
jgi:hypothetical protein